MRIVVIAPSYPPRRGGVERHIEEVVRVLRGRGHEITVLVRYYPDYPPRHAVDGVTVLRLPERDDLLNLSAWVVQHAAIFRRVDAFHTHDFAPLVLKKLFPKTRWVHTFHGYEGYPISKEAIAARQEIRRRVSYCVGVGKFIEKWYGTKLDYITYGAVSEPTKIDTLDESWDILYFGRFEPDSGFRTYVESFELIHKARPKVKLLALGGGSLKEWAEKFADKHDLPIEFHDMVKDVWPFLQASEVIFTSGYLGILESSIMKRPVVAHYETPIKLDYLECHPMAKNFQIGSTAGELAEAYFNTSKEFQSKVNECFEWASAQTWDSLAEHYEAAYKG